MQCTAEVCDVEAIEYCNLIGDGHYTIEWLIHGSWLKPWYQAICSPDINPWFHTIAFDLQISRVTIHLDRSQPWPWNGSATARRHQVLQRRHHNGLQRTADVLGHLLTSWMSSSFQLSGVHCIALLSIFVGMKVKKHAISCAVAHLTFDVTWVGIPSNHIGDSDVRQKGWEFEEQLAPSSVDWSGKIRASVCPQSSASMLLLLSSMVIN